MAIEYPTERTADAAMKCALSHPTYVEGLSWLMAWEHEMALDRYDRVGRSHDRCFTYFIERFTREWTLKHASTLWQLISPTPFTHPRPLVGDKLLPPGDWRCLNGQWTWVPKKPPAGEQRHPLPSVTPKAPPKSG